MGGASGEGGGVEMRDGGGRCSLLKLVLAAGALQKSNMSLTTFTNTTFMNSHPLPNTYMLLLYRP